MFFLNENQLEKEDNGRKAGIFVLKTFYLLQESSKQASETKQSKAKPIQSFEN